MQSRPLHQVRFFLFISGRESQEVGSDREGVLKQDALEQEFDSKEVNDSEQEADPEHKDACGHEDEHEGLFRPLRANHTTQATTASSRRRMTMSAKLGINRPPVYCSYVAYFLRIPTLHQNNANPSLHIIVNSSA